MRALGTPRSHHAHVCNIKMWFRRISFMYAPQATDSYFLKVLGELLFMQRTIFSDFYLFLLLKFKKWRGCNCCWNLACGLLADLSKCCFPIRALPFLCTDLKVWGSCLLCQVYYFWEWLAGSLVLQETNLSYWLSGIAAPVVTMTRQVRRSDG